MVFSFVFLLKGYQILPEIVKGGPNIEMCCKIALLLCSQIETYHRKNKSRDVNRLNSVNVGAWRDTSVLLHVSIL